MSENYSISFNRNFTLHHLRIDHNVYFDINVFLTSKIKEAYNSYITQINVYLPLGSRSRNTVAELRCYNEKPPTFLFKGYQCKIVTDSYDQVEVIDGTQYAVYCFLNRVFNDMEEVLQNVKQAEEEIEKEIKRIYEFNTSEMLVEPITLFVDENRDKVYYYVYRTSDRHFQYVNTFYLFPADANGYVCDQFHFVLNKMSTTEHSQVDRYTVRLSNGKNYVVLFWRDLWGLSSAKNLFFKVYSDKVFNLAREMISNAYKKYIEEKQKEHIENQQIEFKVGQDNYYLLISKDFMLDVSSLTWICYCSLSVPHIDSPNYIPVKFKKKLLQTKFGKDSTEWHVGEVSKHSVYGTIYDVYNCFVKGQTLEETEQSMNNVLEETKEWIGKNIETKGEINLER